MVVVVGFSTLVLVCALSDLSESTATGAPAAWLVPQCWGGGTGSKTSQACQPEAGHPLYFSRLLIAQEMGIEPTQMPYVEREKYVFSSSG